MSISTSAKPIVFISHITEEAPLAGAIKELLEPHFLNLIEFFVSSDGRSIPIGNRWLDLVSENLQNCVIEIVICSPISVKRPWINFEAGAGWVKQIPVIPLCHSGMIPEKLPLPLNLLQAGMMSDSRSLSGILPVLAKALGAAVPKVDFESFIAFVKNYERKCTFWDQCNAAFSHLSKIDNLVPRLRQYPMVHIDMSRKQIDSLDIHLEFLKTQKILEFVEEAGMKMISSATMNGTFYPCRFLRLSNFEQILQSPDFILKNG